MVDDDNGGGGGDDNDDDDVDDDDDDVDDDDKDELFSPKWFFCLKDFHHLWHIRQSQNISSFINFSNSRHSKEVTCWHPTNQPTIVKRTWWHPTSQPLWWKGLVDTQQINQR